MEDLAVGVAAGVVVIPAGPVIAGRPLSADGPGRGGLGVVPAGVVAGVGGEAVGKHAPADGEPRLAPGDVGEAEVPAEGVFGNVDDKEPPRVEGLAGDNGRPAVKVDRGQAQSVNAQGVSGVGVAAGDAAGLDGQGVIGGCGTGDVDKLVVVPGVGVAVVEAVGVWGARQVGVGAQGHVGVGGLVFQMHFQAQGAHGNGELVKLDFAAFEEVVGVDVAQAGGVDGAQLVGGRGSVAVEDVSGAVGADPVAAVIRVHSLARDGQVIGAVGDGVFHRRGAGHEEVLFVALLLNIAAAVEANGRAARRADVGQIGSIDQEHGLAVGGDEPEFPRGLAGRNDHAVVGGFARRKAAGADRPVEGKIHDGDGEIGPDAAAQQGVGHGIGVGARPKDARVVDARFQGVAHAHLEDAAVGVLAEGVVVPAGPIIGGPPLVAAGPAGGGLRIIPAPAGVGAGGKVPGRQVAADDQPGIAAGDVGEADVPAQRV